MTSPCSGEGSLGEILETIPSTPVKVFVSPRGIGFLWSYKGKGFGEIFISLADWKVEDPNELPMGRLRVDSECETKEFVKKVICQAIDESDFQ